MKIHEPEWAGKELRCEKCSTQFTLDASDEKLVRFTEKLSNGIAKYWIKCPKCRKRILFSVDTTKERSSPSGGIMPAPLIEQ
jgi:DNA-directed RNA polymerase subunit RPC12/RpoP